MGDATMQRGHGIDWRATTHKHNRAHKDTADARKISTYDMSTTWFRNLAVSIYMSSIRGKKIIEKNEGPKKGHHNATIMQVPFSRYPLRPPQIF